jgi:hypothetical protein
MRDHAHRTVADHRDEFLRECLTVHDESVGTPEPMPERPILPAAEFGGAWVAQRIVHRENRSIPRRQRQQAGVVVLVNVHDLRPPSAERSSYLEHPRNGRDRPNAARDHHYPDPLALEGREQRISLGCRAPELEHMRAAQNRDVVTGPSQRPRLLRSVLQQEIADDKDAHLEPIQDPPHTQRAPLCRASGSEQQLR